MIDLNNYERFEPEWGDEVPKGTIAKTIAGEVYAWEGLAVGGHTYYRPKPEPMTQQKWSGMSPQARAAWNLPAMEAQAVGKPTQFMTPFGEWQDNTGLMSTAMPYRVKPEPPPTLSKLTLRLAELSKQFQSFAQAVAAE